MGVEDLLPGGLAIGHEEVDAVGADGIGLANLARQAAGDGEQPLGGGIGQVAGVNDVLVWDDEKVARRDRADVEEGADQLVAVDEAGRRITCDDRAEDAAWLGREGAQPFTSVEFAILLWRVLRHPFTEEVSDRLLDGPQRFDRRQWVAGDLKRMIRIGEASSGSALSVPPHVGPGPVVVAVWCGRTPCPHPGGSVLGLAHGYWISPIYPRFPAVHGQRAPLKPFDGQVVSPTSSSQNGLATRSATLQ